jgi:uncharacterized protein YidB (DUF937 family)
MDIMDLGVKLLAQKLGGSANNDMVGQVLGSLLSNSKGDLDLGSLLNGMNGGGLSDLAESWLGDGDNKPVSTNQLESIFGSDKIKEMAGQLGADKGSLLEGLRDALPQMVDKSSQGGELLDQLGGIGGILGMANKLLK